MKNVLIFAVVVILGWGIFSFLNKQEIPPQNTAAAKWVHDYDALLVKYEKDGLKTPEDLARFNADLAVFAETNKSIEISPAEAGYYKDKLENLRERQMKLMQK